MALLLTDYTFSSLTLLKKNLSSLLRMEDRADSNFCSSLRQANGSQRYMLGHSSNFKQSSFKRTKGSNRQNTEETKVLWR